MLIKLMFILLFNMISVGFFILLERKVLGYLNNRLGPNKILFKGLFQFLMDLVKLIFKENSFMILMNFFMYNFMIFFFFIISFFIWLILPYLINLINLGFMILIMLMIMVNKILILMNLIWSINSIYSTISLIRLFIQNFSFEILFMMILFFYMFLYNNLNMLMIMKMVYLNKMIYFSLLIFYFWLISIMVELNRIPFDFLESESELISGMNLEFSSLNFMFFFLIEYLDLIFFSLITLINFLNIFIMYMYMYIILILVLLLFLFFRGFIIRYRMDKLFILLWKVIFPLMMNFIMFILFIKLIYLLD
uniref:NADH-ubiquinone oxidoreductase chain 1 n=1 Tax=Maconellicoccus hirsutus TaxID=177089 RepID=Q5DKX5_MACHI|nr:NADH dehydrogenase subunit 1 [Maconellicoccus hirsutus]